MNPFLPPTPPPLPPPPFLEHFTLESPWAAAILLLIAALLAWRFIPNSPPHARRLCTALAFALAVGLLVMARAVETPRERVARLTRDLVATVATADSTAVRAILADDAALYWWLNPEGLPLAGILDRIDRDFASTGQYRVRDHAILDIQSQFDPPARARVQVQVRVTSHAEGVPLISWWRLDFEQRDTNRWLVTGIQPLAIPSIANPRGR